jgi:Ca2+-binding EF-hand superfamily protein
MQKTKLLVTAVLMGTLVVGFVAPALAKRGPGNDGNHMFLFDQFDADKDGKVTKAELDASRAARVKAADANGDGLMSADELAAMQLADMTLRAKSMAAEMVARLDSDGDGLLSAAELATRPGPEKMFDRIDTDSDGSITRAEADAAAAKMSERHGERGRKIGDDQPQN